MKWFTIILGTLSAVSQFSLGADTASPAAIAEFVQQLDPIVATQSTDSLSAELAQDVRRRRRRINEQDVHAWRALESLEDWQDFKQRPLAALRESLGDLPQPPHDLNLRVTRTIKGDGYSIACLVFESRPGLLVTANLYRPDKPRESMPGILICHSHHNPKTQGELQDMGMNWARSGCLVLVMDQLGHGERRQHPFRTAKDYAGDFQRGRQDYYFRYNVGIQLHLIGDSLVGWMVWDLMRGVDLLLGEPGVDPERIILLGAVAGGGDPCAVAAALDESIAAAVPFNFGGPQPESVFPLPADAELSFNYVGGGSWESTRNLRASGQHGFLPWVIVGSIAPRRLIYAHEFSWDRQHDPVWRRLESLYERFDASDRLASVHGYGRVQLSSSEASHCNNIGEYHRRQIYPLFARWFGIEAPEPERRDRRPAMDLYCVEGVESARDIRLPKVHELADGIAKARIKRFGNQLAALSAGQRRERLRDAWSRVLGLEPNNRFNGPSVSLAAAQPIRVLKTTRRTDRFSVPLILLAPERLRDQGCPCVVAVAQGGKAGFLKHRAAQVAELLSNGIAVCLPDLPGSGETSSSSYRGRRSTATGISSSRLMLGGTIVGDRLSDLLSIVGWLRTLDEIDGERIAVWGDSFARVNPPQRNVAVPLRIDDEPDQAEPLGATLSLLAALFDSRIKSVVARGGIVSIRSVLASQFIYLPHDWVVPGALTAGDLPQLVAALGPVPVRIEGLVDGANRRASPDLTNATWSDMAPSETRFVSSEPTNAYIAWLTDVLVPVSANPK